VITVQIQTIDIFT